MSNDERVRAGKSAFIKAKREMISPRFNKTNPHFKNKYADYKEIRRCAYPALKENNLSIRTGFKVIDGMLMLLNTIIYDADVDIGENSEWPISMAVTPQQQGSAATYAKRYNLSTLCDLLADEDDDANTAEAPPQEENSTQRALKKEGITVEFLKEKLGEISKELCAVEDGGDYSLLMASDQAKDWGKFMAYGNKLFPKGMENINKIVNEFGEKK